MQTDEQLRAFVKSRAIDFTYGDDESPAVYPVGVSGLVRGTVSQLLALWKPKIIETHRRHVGYSCINIAGFATAGTDCAECEQALTDIIPGYLCIQDPGASGRNGQSHYYILRHRQWIRKRIAKLEAEDAERTSTCDLNCTCRV